MTRVTTPDGVRYALSESGQGAPLLLIHGFTGSAASWAAQLPTLTRDHRVLAIELLGHGGTDRPPAERHLIELQAADLAYILGWLGAVPADVLGYSLGARVALRLAVDARGSVRRLILESPSAGIADPASRAARRVADQRWVDQLQGGDMDGFVRDWAEQPIFASQAGLAAAAREHLAAERRNNDPAGLAASLLGAGQGTATPIHGRLGDISAPTLVISGALDTRGTERAAEVARGIPGAVHSIIDDAGHTPHLETPERFTALVTSALATPFAESIPTHAS